MRGGSEGRSRRYLRWSRKKEAVEGMVDLRGTGAASSRPAREGGHRRWRRRGEAATGAGHRCGVRASVRCESASEGRVSSKRLSPRHGLAVAHRGRSAPRLLHRPKQKVRRTGFRQHRPHGPVVAPSIPGQPGSIPGCATIFFLFFKCV